MIKKKKTFILETIKKSPTIQINANPNSLQVDQDNGSNDLDAKWEHLKYDWLEEDKIKDLDGRRKTDPYYDSKTVYVPDRFKKDLTPGLKQWWEIKSKNFDVILFFKVGKFYELYHVNKSFLFFIFK